MSKALLNVKDLHVVYRGDHDPVYAANGISFSLEQGKTIGLVGETGAGKTTTALSIMGLLPKKVGFIEQGSIEFEGKDLLSLPQKEYQKIRGNEISMIFQDPMTCLNPVYTIGNQLMEALTTHQKISKTDAIERIVELLTLVGINEPRRRIKQYPHELSGGMRQRIMIAMALAGDPKILIADEPTTALDVTIQAQILELI